MPARAVRVGRVQGAHGVRETGEISGGALHTRRPFHNMDRAERLQKGYKRGILTKTANVPGVMAGEEKEELWQDAI